MIATNLSIAAPGRRGRRNHVHRRPDRRPEHAGNYLRCGIEAEPNANIHHTPLGTWYQMTSLEVANFQEFLRSMGKGNNASVCEECRGWA